MYFLSHIILLTRHVEEPDARPTTGAGSGSGKGGSGGRGGGRGRRSRPGRIGQGSGGPLPTTNNNAGLGTVGVASIITAMVNATAYGISNSRAHIGGRGGS